MNVRKTRFAGYELGNAEITYGLIGVTKWVDWRVTHWVTGDFRGYELVLRMGRS